MRRPRPSLNRRTLFRAAPLNLEGLEDRSVPAAFTPGNLVVYRVGDGTAVLSTAATAVFLDEFTTAGVLIQSIPLPTTASGANRPLTASGMGVSEGLLTRSADGRFLVLAGYDAAVGTASVSGTPSATTPRVVGRVDANGAIDTTTALTDVSSGSSPRGVATTDGNNLWVGGGGGGLWHTTLGATTSTQLNTTVTSIRGVNIFAGQLYISTSTSPSVRIGTVGNGLPTTSGQTIANLPGYPTDGAPHQFVFADLSPSVAGVDTLYVADDTTSGGQLQKYSLVGGAWVLNNGLSAGQLRGLTAVVTGTTVQLFGTAVNTVFSHTDTTGYNANLSGTVTTLAPSGATKAYRGIALVPETPPPAVVSVARAAASPTNASSVDYTVTFSEGVTGVDAADFVLTTTDVSGASVGTVTGSGTTYTVSVNTGTGDGTVRLDVGDDDSIVNGGGVKLGGTGAGNGNFTGGQVYAIDRTAPTVSGITRAGTSPTNAAGVDYTVTFSEAVTGVGAGDFAVTTTGVSGASVTNVTGSGTTYTVTVNTGSGDGAIRLDLTDDDSITDPATNKLGGTGAGSGGFTAGQAYTIDRTAPTVAGVARAAGPFANAASVQFTVTFGEAVSGVTAAAFAPTGSLAGAAVGPVSGGPQVYTVTVTTGTGEGTLGLDVPASAAVTDAAGNPLAAAFTGGETYTLDRAAPNVTLSAPSAFYAGAGPVDFLVTYSDANPLTITLTEADVTLIRSGTADATVQVVGTTGNTRTVRLTGITGNGFLSVSVAAGTAADGAGNAAPAAGPSAPVEIDTVAPTVTSAVSLVPGPTNSPTAAVLVTFSEPLTAPAPAAFTLTTTGTVSGAAVYDVVSAGNPLEYLVFFTTGAGDGTVRVDVPAGPGIADRAGNPLAAAFATGDVLTVLKTSPTVAITSPLTGTTIGPVGYSGDVTGTAADALGGAADRVEVTIERDSDGLYWDGSAWVAFGSAFATVTGATWSLPFPASVQTTGVTYQVRVAAADRAGNGSTSTPGVTYTWDAAEPVASVAGLGAVFGPTTWGGITGGSFFDAGPAGVAAVEVVVTRSSDGKSYDAAAGDWTNGGVVNPGAPGGFGWELPLPAADLDHGVTYTVTAAAVDGAGNRQSLPGSGTFDYDAVAPIATVTTGGFNGPNTWPVTNQITGTVADGGPAGVAEVGLLVQRLDDAAYWNGTAFTPVPTPLTAALAAGGWVYTLPAPALTDGATYQVTAVAVDAAGNGQSAPASGTFAWDATAPVAAIDPIGDASFAGPVGFTGFSGTAADAGSGAAGVALALTRQSDGFAWDGAAFVAGGAAPAATLTGSTWAYAFDAANLADGETYTLTATAGDVVLNVGTAASATFVLDAAGPTTTVTAPAGTVTATTWTGLAGTASDAAAGVQSIEYRVLNAAGDVWDGTTFAASGTWFTAAGTTNWSAAFPFADFPASGGYRVEARGVDAVGNVGPVAAADFTVALPTVTGIARLNPAAVTNTTGPVTWRVTFSDPVSGLTAANFALAGSFAGAASVTAVAPAGGTAWDVTATVPAAGTGTLGLDFVSPAGLSPVVETAAFTGAVFTLDRVAPTAVVTTDASGSVVRAGTPVRYTVTLADDTAVALIAASDGDVANAAPGGASFTVSNFAVGANVITFDVTPTSGGAFQLLLTNPVVLDTAGNALAVPVTDANVLTADGTSPSVMSIVPSVTGRTNAAEVSYTVTFSEAVTGVDAADFALVTAGLSGAAITSVAGGGHTYVVVVATGAGAGTLRLDAADDDTVTDLPGNPLGGTFTGPPLAVDRVAPTASVAVAPGQPAATNAQPIRFAVTFSEPVVGFDAAAVALSGSAGGLAGAAVAVTNPAADGMTFEVAVSGLTGDGFVSVAVAAGFVEDLAGNALVPAPPSAPVSFDATAPAVAAVVADVASPTNATAVTYTVTFSEAVTGVDVGDFVLTTAGVSGATVAGVTGGGAVYTVTIDGVTGDGTVRLDLTDDDTIADAAGNLLDGTGTGDLVTIDQTAPTATVVGPPPALRNTPVAGVAVTFDEPVTGLGVSAFTLTRDGVPLDLSAATLTGTGDRYTLDGLAALTGVSGAYVLTLDAGRAAVFDAAGNPLAASASASFTVDATAPTVAIVPVTAGPTNAATLAFTVAFSEPVGGVDADPAGGFDFLAVAGTAPGTSVLSVTAGAPGVYTVVVGAGTGVGTVALRLAANAAVTDAAGNAVAGLPVTSAVVAVDRVSPTVPLTDADADGIVAVNVPVVFTADVLDASAVTGTLSAADFSNAGTAPVTIGAVTAAPIAGGVRFSVPVTPTGGGTLMLRLDSAALADAAGNAPVLPVLAARTLAVDAAAPAVTVARAAGQPALTNAQPVRFAVAFGEPVVGFDAAKVTLAGPGTAAATVQVAGDGQTFAVSVSGLTADGAVTLTVAGGVVADVAGNPSAASAGTDNTVTLDATPPAAGAPVLEPASDTGAPDGVTRVGTPTFTGTAEAGATVVLYEGATVLGTATATGGTWAITAALADGPRAVFARATDAAGNAADSAALAVTIDTVSPAVAVTRAPGQAGTVVGSGGGAGVTFAVTTTQAVGGLDPGAVAVVGTAGGTVTAVTGGGTAFLVTVGGITRPGTVTVAVAAGAGVDIAGNPTLAAPAGESVAVEFATTGTLAVTPAGLRAGDAVTVAAVLTSAATIPVAGTLVYTLAGPAGTATQTVAVAGGAAPAVTFPAVAAGDYTVTAAFAGSGGFRAAAVGGGFAVAPSIPAGQNSTGVFAAAAGTAVTLVNADGTVKATAAPFTRAEAPFGVRVAVADVTGDGVPDLVAGTAAGAAARVRVLDGATGATVHSLPVFEGFTGGTFVAAGDLNGDGKAEVVVTPDQSGGPRVLVFDGATGAPLASFLGIDDPAFRGGARVAVGDLNRDGVSDLLVSAGFGGGPRVAGFDGLGVGAGAPRKLFNDFFLFAPDLRDGAHVAVGDVDGDGYGEVIGGAAGGGAPRVLALSGRELVTTGALVPVSNFFAGPPDLRGGVRVAAKDFDGDGRADLVTGSGDTGDVFLYPNAALTGPDPRPAGALDTVPGLLAGVHVG